MRGRGSSLCLELLLALLACFCFVSCAGQRFEDVFFASSGVAAPVTLPLAPGTLPLAPQPSSITWTRKFARVVTMGTLDGLSIFGARQTASATLITNLLQSMLQSSVPLQRWPNVSTPELASPVASGHLTFVFLVSKPLNYPQWGDDESYHLQVSAVSINSVACVIEAPTSTGALRALATFMQMFYRVPDPSTPGLTLSLFVPVNVDIRDAPASTWRGLMVDVARRYQDLDNLKRICTSMFYLKMNTLHLHLTDDQNWAFESFTWPRLHQVGSSPGRFYRQQELSGLVDYCASFGVRVVPEINLPGHCAAAVFAYPQLSPEYFPSSPVQYWGTFDYTLDVSQGIVLLFVRNLVSELAVVFVDNFIHLGGDEVVWHTPSDRMKNWMRSQGLNTSTLQTYFTNNIAIPMVTSVGKNIVLWDDARFGVPASPSVWFQWWDDIPTIGSDHVKSGTVLSLGYYLNLLPTTYDVYSNPAGARPGIGMEACMWTENADVNLDTRIFPQLLGLSMVSWGSASVSEASVDFLSMSHDLKLRAVGAWNRVIYEQSILNFLSTGQFAVTYAQLTAAPTTQQEFSSAFYTISNLTDILKAAMSNRMYTESMDLVDVLSPQSHTLVLLKWLARQAVEVEMLDAKLPATSLLTSHLRVLANMSAAVTALRLPLTDGSAFVAIVAKDVSLIAAAWLRWIAGVQSNVPSAPLRAAALGTGQQFYSSAVNPGRLVLNGLKSDLEAVLLQQDMGSFAVATTSSASLVTSGGSTGPSTSSAAVSQSSSVGLAVGLTVGLVFLLGVGLLIVLFLFKRRNVKNKALKVALPTSFSHDDELDTPINPAATYSDFVSDDDSVYGVIGGSSRGGFGSSATTPTSENSFASPAVGHKTREAFVSLKDSSIGEDNVVDL